jgi:sigma-B regulation protein RsbU (phosphoserine phosphatase)
MTTAAVVAFYVKDCRLYFCYAGHPPVLVRHEARGSWQPAQQQHYEGHVNLPLGVIEETGYVLEQMPLCKGDRLFLYTDGLIEAPNGSGQLYGIDRLMSVLAEAGGDSLMALKTAVLTDVRRHAGGHLTHDDVTLMAIEVN